MQFSNSNGAVPHMTNAIEIPEGYKPQSPATLAAYLSCVPSVVETIGGEPSDWSIREVGDGNLNLVFIVKGPSGGVAVKQALPYVRLVGEAWPLPLTRAHYEQRPERPRRCDQGHGHRGRHRERLSQLTGPQRCSRTPMWVALTHHPHGNSGQGRTPKPASQLCTTGMSTRWSPSRYRQFNVYP